MGAESFKFSGNKVAGDDTLSLSVNNYKIKHLMTRIALYRTGCNFLVKGSIGTEKELLTGLSAGIECTAYLYTAE